MNLLFRVRRWLARLALRGPVMDWWLRRRGRQVDAAFGAKLVEELKGPGWIKPLPVLVGRAKIRQILLIADCLWEQRELLPELGRIAETRLLNLRESLGKIQESPEARVAVVEAVRRFMEANSALVPDVILFYLRPGLLSDEVFEVLRGRWKCPLFGMNLDDKMEFFPNPIFASGNHNYQHWAKKFDLNITNCLPATDWYRARDLPCLYSPQGVHLTPELTCPTSSNFKYKLSFVGQVKVERKHIVNRLQQAGIHTELFGTGWPGAQWVDNPNSIFRTSQINLGIGFASPSFTLTTVKNRDFECPGAGGCYLTSYSWELPLHFVLGTELLCYRSVEELIEMYGWYSKRPEECLKIAQAGWRRCAAEHTWEQRFRQIFERTGFKCE
jgi:spore maturation protein CgeB